MQDIQNNALFTEVSAEASATVSGGTFNFNLNKYTFILGAAFLFGNPGITPAEFQFAWEEALEF